MKICVVGPVNTDKYFGGVGLFTESISYALEQLNHDVEIITDYSDKESVSGININIVSKVPSRKNIFKMRKINNIIREKNPDIIISSLEYSLFIKKIIGIKKIHFIHGFPSIKHYGIIKSSIMIAIDRIIGRKFDFIICNSNFTKVINTDIYKNRVDKVIGIGLGREFISDLQEIKKKRNKKITFIGRLVDVKNVDIIIKSYRYLKSNFDGEFTLTIVGDGPERKKLEMMSNGLDVKFVGKVDTEKTLEYYKESEIFISLNAHEPFGMVYLEALANGCKIIAPNTGGQLDYLMKYNDRVRLVNINEEIEIAQAIKELCDTEIEQLNLINFKEQHDYKNTAVKILKLASEELK